MLKDCHTSTKTVSSPLNFHKRSYDGCVCPYSSVGVAQDDVKKHYIIFGVLTNLKVLEFGELS